MLKSILIPINKAGFPFIIVFAGITAILYVVWEPLGWVFLVLTLWCTYFFRDPPRVIPNRAGLVVSPADGVVQMIKQAVPPPELELEGPTLLRISVFMNVFNVHVNRIPIASKVIKLAYRHGKFFNASLEKSSLHNECQFIKLSTSNKSEIGVVQIAGLIARRIKCDLATDQMLKTGERFGLIRFGSRVDIFLPPGTSAMVIEGQQMIAGETVIADLKSKETSRCGDIK